MFRVGADHGSALVRRKTLLMERADERLVRGRRRPGDGCWPQLGVIDLTTGERVPLSSMSGSSTDASGRCFTGGAGNWSVNLKLDAAAFTSGHEYQVVAEMYACYGFDALEPGNDTFSVK